MKGSIFYTIDHSCGKRADAARNLEAVVTAGTRLLAADIASIATAAGVD
ncbi:hypothetical protein ACFYZI_37040 [Streptomyces griseorubiginosus]